MLDGTARSWLKGLPPNSIGSWEELKARFIQNFKDTCKQSMSIVDLTDCKQEEGESTTHWVRRVKEIIHSSDKMDAGSAVLMLEKNCRFEPLPEPPVRSPDVFGLAPGDSHRAGYGVGRCLTKLRTPCACCNSGSGSGEVVLTRAGEWNESCPSCKNRSPAEPMSSGEVL